MAKDLPYFKFFCSEWNDGDITLEEMEIQGLFINVCSYYWSNECNITIDKLKKRFKHNKENIDYLLKIDMIHDENGCLEINFLDEQKEDREASRASKVKGGLASAEARRVKKEQEVNRMSTESQHVLNSCSTESQLLREEKRREEKIREDNINKTKEQLFLEDWNELRLTHLKKKSNIKTLSGDDKDKFKELIKSYTREEMQSGLVGLFKQKKLPNDNQVMQSNPKHFLQYFNSYLTAFLDKNTNLYGKQEDKQY